MILFRSAAFLLVFGVTASSVLAAGGTLSPPTPAPAPKVTIVKPVKPKKPVAVVTVPVKKPSVAATVAKKPVTAVAKKIAPLKTTIAAVAPIVDDWAKTFGDLGPAYISAVRLAKLEKYDATIKAMTALNKPDDPRVNNWIGYSLRKMGKVDEAMPYYDKALKAAPKFTPAHEYLGEAYVQMKDAAKAKDQLAQIETLCGNKTCEEYMDLSEAIAKAKL